MVVIGPRPTITEPGLKLRQGLHCASSPRCSSQILEMVSVTEKGRGTGCPEGIGDGMMREGLPLRRPLNRDLKKNKSESTLISGKISFLGTEVI